MCRSTGLILLGYVECQGKYWRNKWKNSLVEIKVTGTICDQHFISIMLCCDNTLQNELKLHNTTDVMINVGYQFVYFIHISGIK